MLRRLKHHFTWNYYLYTNISAHLFLYLWFIVDVNHTVRARANGQHTTIKNNIYICVCVRHTNMSANSKSCVSTNNKSRLNDSTRTASERSVMITSRRCRFCPETLTKQSSPTGIMGMRVFISGSRVAHEYSSFLGHRTSSEDGFTPESQTKVFRWHKPLCENIQQQHLTLHSTFNL